MSENPRDPDSPGVITGDTSNIDHEKAGNETSGSNIQANTGTMENNAHFEGFVTSMNTLTTAMSTLAEALKTSKPDPLAEDNEDGTRKNKSNVQDDARLRQEMRPLMGEDDYTRKYPNDDYGAEMGPNARVWKTYIDEREIVDKDYMSDNNGTLDGILVFASIFSAIVATFVTQTYQSLRPDSQTALQESLSELIAVQRAAANGSSVNSVPSYADSSPTFKAELSDIWLNSLWFISLILSLLTAFFGVLAKQWLYQYVSVTSGTARERALIRHARSLGLHDWHVPALIGFLPIILHLSLGLFLVGLMILLHSLLLNIAYLGIALAGTVYTAYIISNLLPLIYPRCPYRTALTPRMYQLYYTLPPFPRITFPSHTDTESSTWKVWQLISCLPHLEFSKISISANSKAVSWKDAERNDALNTRGVLEAEALSWLYSSSYNPSAQQVVLEASAGLGPELDQYINNWDENLLLSGSEDLQHRYTRLCSTSALFTEDIDRQLELYLRAWVHFQPVHPAPESWQGPFDYTPTLSLPNTVTIYIQKHWNASQISPNLKTLILCGFYVIKVDRGYRYSVASIPGEHEMAIGTWMKWTYNVNTSLWQQEQQLKSVSGFMGNRMAPVWATTCWRILHQTGFFTDNPSFAESSSFTANLQKPTKHMSEAIFHLLVYASGVSKKAKPLETMLNILRLDTWLNESYDSLIPIIDCILDYVHKETFGSTDIWSRKETKLLCDFALETTYSKQQTRHIGFWDLQIRILWLLEDFCLPHHFDCIPKVLELWLPIALDCFLNQGLKDERAQALEALVPTKAPYLGLKMMCWGFDHQLRLAYICIWAKNAFCNTNWLSMHTERAYYDNHKKQVFMTSFLKGISTDQECALENFSSAGPSHKKDIFNYICQPDVLQVICHILHSMIHFKRYSREFEDLNEDDRNQRQASKMYLHLLSFKEISHDVWTACLAHLKLDARTCSENWLTYYQSQLLMKDIFAIQEILGIHTSSDLVSEVLGTEIDVGIWEKWDLSQDNKLLEAYQLGLQPKAPENESQIVNVEDPEAEGVEVNDHIKHHFNWRNMFPFHKRHTADLIPMIEA